MIDREHVRLQAYRHRRAAELLEQIDDLTGQYVDLVVPGSAIPGESALAVDPPAAPLPPLDPGQLRESFGATVSPGGGWVDLAPAALAARTRRLGATLDVVAGRRVRSASEDDGAAPATSVPPAEPTKGESPAPPTSSPRRPRSLDEAENEIRKVAADLAGDEWASLRDLAAKAGVSESSAKRVIRSLVDDGVMQHNGKMRAGSKYRLTPPKPVRRPPLDAAGVDHAQHTTKEGTPQGRVLSALNYRAMSCSALAQTLELPVNVVADAVERLYAEGEVMRAGHDGVDETVWTASR